MSNEEMKRKVREEKRQYEETVVGESRKTLEKVEKQDKLVPISDISNKLVTRLLREYYDDEVLEHIKIPESNLPGLIKSLRTMNKNVIKFSAPLMCKSHKCPMGDRCPLQKAGVSPTGHSCPIELMLIDQWEKEYIEDLGIDTQSKIEIDLVRDMIESDIIDWRTSHELAKGGLFDWNNVGVTSDGKAIIRKEENAAIGIKLKFKARKDKLREDLMATRKIKAKFGLNKQIDPSRFASDLQQRFKNVEAEVMEDSKMEMDTKQEMKLDKNGKG